MFKMQKHGLCHIDTNDLAAAELQDENSLLPLIVTKSILWKCNVTL